MMPIEWESKYEIGLKLIDEQHRRIFNVYNQLLVLQQKQHPCFREDILKTFEDLADYIHLHFTTEEEIMRIYGFPQFKEHKLEHEEFTLKINKLKKDFQEGDMLLMDSLVKMIRVWIINHVLVEDLKYKPFIPKDNPTLT